jgi:hypothetical protein
MKQVAAVIMSEPIWNPGGSIWAKSSVSIKLDLPSNVRLPTMLRAASWAACT